MHLQATSSCTAMHYKIITMLFKRTDCDKSIKPRIKTTCIHFYEITQVQRSLQDSAITKAVRVFNPNITFIFTRHYSC